MGSFDLTRGNQDTGGASLLLLKVERLASLPLPCPPPSPEKQLFLMGENIRMDNSWNCLIIPSETISHVRWKDGQDPKSLNLQLVWVSHIASCKALRGLLRQLNFKF